MGRLIIDGNSVFEIDEECLKRRKPDKNCEIDKYMERERHLIDKVYDRDENMRKHIK